MTRLPSHEVYLLADRMTSAHRPAPELELGIEEIAPLTLLHDLHSTKASLALGLAVGRRSILPDDVLKVVIDRSG
jgi:hypothetical protein